MNRFIKRLFAYLLVLSLVMFANCVYAYETDTPIVLLCSASGNVGDEIKIDVIISNNPGVAYLKLKINYDNTALMLVGANNTGAISGIFTTSKMITVEPYVLQWMGADNSTNNGTIATITFTALKEGTTNISVTVDECYNTELNDIFVTSKSTTVKISPDSCTHENSIGEWQSDETKHYHICDECGEKIDMEEHMVSDWIIDIESTTQIAGKKHKECAICGRILQTEIIPKIQHPGDITGDGAVDSKDLVRLKKYLAGQNVEYDELNSDCNGDGKVDVKDLVRLKKYLAGQEVTLGS